MHWMFASRSSTSMTVAAYWQHSDPAARNTEYQWKKIFLNSGYVAAEKLNKVIWTSTCMGAWQSRHLTGVWRDHRISSIETKPEVA